MAIVQGQRGCGCGDRVAGLVGSRTTETPIRRRGRMKRRKPTLHRYLYSTLVGLVLLLISLTAVHAGDRWRGDGRGPREFPYTDRFEGSRRWRPDRSGEWDMPDRFTIDRPGKCEVRCEREGRGYRCREYRC